MAAGLQSALVLTNAHGVCGFVGPGMGVTLGSPGVTPQFVTPYCALKLVTGFCREVCVRHAHVQYRACAYMQTCTLKLSSHVAHAVAM